MSRQAPNTAFTKSKTLDNKYMLGDEIGKGAYGRVYKGLDLENGDFVAIKQVSLENIAQEDLNIIMQEIDLLKNLNHKNIVKYLGSSKTKSHLHIVLEYVENGSLANIIKPNKFGPFPESLVALYIAQVLEGLVYLHEQGVIHRDIKGANILTTKEGLVKLADFGVATKLTEADVNTHSVVGTPYWMAPEVIEMAGVCAASDIWSVGCTVIELLTCVPPYYDLQPMPALFRIVQDEHPPIPDSLSPDITDFLLQCFKKDSRQRPDAKTLLSHPWIQNFRRVLQSSLRHSGTLRNIEEDDSADAEVSGGYHKSAYEGSSVEKEDSSKELSSGAAHDSKSHEDNASVPNERTEKADHVPSDQVLTLAIREKSFLQTGSSKLSPNREVGNSEPTGDHEISNAKDLHEVMMNGEVGSPKSKVMASKTGGKDSSVNNGNKSFAFGPRGQDNGSLKAMKMPTTVEGNELSRFSDPPGDAYLDDLFHALDKQPGEVAAEASTSTSTSHMVKGNTSRIDGGKNDLAKELRATIARKQWEKESEIGQANNGGNLLHRVMIGVLKDDVIDIDGLVFDEKLPGENLFPLQAVEFSKLVGSLKPEESEDVIVSACQKLIGIFNQRPEQKIVFVTQHGLLPLTDLLEVPKTRVICSVLQLINQIVKDNTDFLENACLVGLIPAVTSFAVPDRPREIRMEAAYFLQQLCQSSSLTLQMFIACRGIPVLVGFLEADYAKYREMVHLAIDGMWQVFKLQQSTPRNDFCRIAAKNGILLRLINTLYSLNESTRLASSSAGGGFSQTPTPRRTPLLPSESDNALAPPRRPKAREVTSRYMSSSSSSSSSVSSPPRRCHSPLVVTRTVNSTKQTPTPALKRCQSAERRRQGTPRPTLTDAPAAQKVLFTSTRSLSVSFQGESFPIQVRTTKPPPSQSLRKSTPERRKVSTTPTPVRNGNSDHAENARSGLDRHRWPAKSLPRPQQVNCANRSLECVDSAGRKQTDAPENLVRSLQNLMEDVLPYHDAMLKSESNKINGSEFRPEPELEPVASDTESVTSGSSSGDGIRRSRGIVVPPRFWQEHNNRLRRQTETPSSRNGVIANKGTLSTAHSPRLLVQKKSVLDSAVSSPRGVVNSRVLQGSPIRSAVRPASPSKLATPSVWSPSRGVSPSRAQNGVAGCMSSRFGSEPSVLSFAVDVSRGKVGENRIADAHLLRLFHNRLLQWRFVNARADAALSAQTFNAEENLKAAWVAMSKMRESVRAKKTEFQLLKQQFKLINILKDQMLYLEDWATLDRVYSSSLSGATEALKASTLRLPVVGGAKTDLLNLKDAICSAMDVMQAMASSICLLSPKVGQLNSLVVDVANLSAKERVLLEECEDLLSLITTLQVRECSLRTHVAQLKCQPRSTAVKITSK